MLLGATAAVLQAAPVHADEPIPAHRVTYTVTSDGQLDVDVYYREVDPPTWAEYSHNPYQFSPKAEASLAPGQPWVREVTLIDPDRWAMVAISRTSTSRSGSIRCTLAVDGETVAAAEGNAGAVCSLRNW